MAKLVFDFGDGAKISLVFYTEPSKNNGNRVAESIVDADGQGMTVHCYNFKVYSPMQEGLSSEPQFVFTKDGKKYYLNFRTSLFNLDSRVININFMKDK
ncbi:Uncharacterised protein [Cedecea neteri]|uniref:Uncharacterized protein n=1 Tax=Cedecea neteri TaxID=158822 RepID=A0A2X3IP87_9ENTR|nr:Uncharacterised protein [Cedecea neteri]